MPFLPAAKPFEPKQAESIEERFHRLESQWLKKTGHHSSSTKIIGHPAFQEITSLGVAVIPFMLRDLAEKQRLWVWALPEITGVDAVPLSDRGNISKMSEAWIRWGRANGYKW
jgi:hypothetical protein